LPGAVDLGTHVVASNLGGGIARHLELVRSVITVEVLELPERLPLLRKMECLRGHLRKHHPRTLVSHGVAAAIAARHRGSRLERVRHVEVWHGDPFFLAPRHRLAAYRGLARAGLPPDLQVFTNQWLVGLFGDPRSDHQVLPNAVPDRELTPKASDVSARLAVYIGRLSPEKGYQDLLAAWPADSLARAWRLEVFGTGPLTAETRPTDVKLRHQTDDPLRVLAHADLLVVPSWTETGPYTAAEAMSVGTPFVGTRTGDMPEFLSSGCGWLVPTREPDRLRLALMDAQQETPENLARRGELGRQWLRTHRVFEHWASAIEGIYSL